MCLCVSHNVDDDDLWHNYKRINMQDTRRMIDVIGIAYTPGRLHY